MKYHDLHTSWQLKQRNPEIQLADDFVSTEHWLPATVPGVVHLDLLAADQIPEPFYGLNEAELQWIGERDWLYRNTFEVTNEDLAGADVVLCFDGLDTYASVWLNGVHILTSDNMFVPQRIPVKSHLRVGQNELYIAFESALLRGKQLEAEYKKLPLWNGDSSRLYVRKAQYHYGWDWGPVFMTAGLWRGVRLESYDARIADVHCPYEVAEDLQRVRLPVEIQLEASTQAAAQEVHIALYAPSGELAAETTVRVEGQQAVHAQLALTQPQLWWPNGYGEQPLYRLVTTLRRAEGEQVDQHELRLGLRRLQLQQQPLQDAPGSSFYFEINNTPIFCGGANWIPADSFLTRITRERYRQWLQLAVDGNMTMLRVWGGGIYEDPAFYEYCDELGLLVWQDFLFGCGIYPAHASFQQSVRAEAEAAVRQLRHHASIVLWCANNEDYAIAESQKLSNPEIHDHFEETAFPARAIYEQLLPEVCQRLDGTRPYWRGSPYGGKASDDTTVGDVHIWRVWHGGSPYQDYPKLAGRFVSEFGMQSFPALETIQSFAPDSELYPQSRTLDYHNKAEGGPGLMAPYLVDNVRVPADLPGQIYATQFVQSEALSYAIRGWRRLWQGPGREYTSGALVWQLNDCYPVMSWAMVDYYLRVKPAYYSVARELAPFAVGLARQNSEQAGVWAVNGTTEQVTLELELRTVNLQGELLSEQSKSVVLPANRSTELDLIQHPQNDEVVLQARLLKDGVVLSRATLWNEPYKYLTLSDPELSIERIDATTVSISATRPVKGVWLDAGPNLKWSDNMLDIIPGDTQTIVIQGTPEHDLQIRWLDKP
ncbi:beta-mannosidase [Dictyobacter alpinus]|uniref:Beta-mannosidase B n=1 Tax=Dictyobacter alpinus TaxID=2014873 RepID=A0A402B3X9_9CHLR|nr:glycoside hydrolase family 2 protein [Dictyobacter alpinus]GCE26059.1 beta-mannosidase [Dictyobacter alpinus]